MAQVAEPGAAKGSGSPVRLAVVDTDCHVGQMGFMHPDLIGKYVPKRWIDHLGLIGMNMYMIGGERPRQRQFAHRTDTVPPGGGSPGGDFEMAVAQVLDAYDMSGSIMNDLPFATGAKNGPDGLYVALSRAANEYRRDEWLARDSRWYAAINVTQECADEAVKEIVRCKEADGEFGDRWISVMLAPDALHPAGNHRYWPIYEACEHYGIPISYHVLASRRTGAVGHTTYYMEEHTDFALFNFHTVSSLVFEGVFERFPRLNVSMIELAWSWATAYSWRLDGAWRKLKEEIAPHFSGERKPSEVFAEHFWFSTQPMEEPDNAEWVDDVYEAFCGAGFKDKLMYSSDYPHWDFDAPDALWETLSVEERANILGGNASRLYGIPLRPDTGLELTPEGMPVPYAL